MKILHTSDWHIGQIFNFHYDRQEEHQFFFNNLKEIIFDEKPDLLLISGDVYDKSTPSSSSMRFFSDNLFEIVDENPNMAVIITAGNHDSGMRIETDQEVWKRHNTYFVGSVEREDDEYVFDKHIIEIKDKCLVAAVPYLQSYYNDFYNLILDEIEKRNSSNLPVVLMGHTTIGNSIFDSHEQTSYNGRITVGGIDSINLADVSDKYDYFALGHIHTPQTLGNGKARYCGSPVQINFKENFTHSVTIVELDKHGENPEIREIVVPQLRKFHTLPPKPMPIEEALAYIKENLPNDSGYFQANFLSDGFIPADTESRIRKIIEKNPDLLYCEFKYTTQQNDDTQNLEKKDFGLSEFKEQDPLDIARRYYSEFFNGQLDDTLVGLLHDVIEEVRNENAEH